MSPEPAAPHPVGTDPAGEQRRSLLTVATRTLAAAGIDSAAAEASLLLAHTLGVEPGRLILVDVVDSEMSRRFLDLVARRSAHTPLQHLTGRAHFGGVDLAVGPGVFIPRPETELLLEWAAPSLTAASVAVDLCSGSGALALGMAASAPQLRVHAVENSASALEWLRRNVSEAGEVGERVAVHDADVTDRELPVRLGLHGAVDVVLTNPPYIPVTDDLPADVEGHDPHEALFGGDDGMAVITPMIGVIADLLRDGGVVALEHDDGTAHAVIAAFVAEGAFADVTAHRDLAGRPRFVTARRRAR